MYSDIYRLIILLTIISGTLGGFSLAASFLSYGGKAPVNVSLYLMFFVFLQILILISTIIAFFARSLFKMERVKGLVYPFFGKRIFKLIELIKKSVFNKLSAEKRNAIESSLGLIKGKRRVYGSVFFWPVFREFR